MTLCERFPSLTPFDIRKQRAYDVFLLIRRLNFYSRGNEEHRPGTTIIHKNGDTIIRRPAKDDSWF